MYLPPKNPQIPPSLLLCHMHGVAVTLSEESGSILHLFIVGKKAEHLPLGHLAVTTESILSWKNGSRGINRWKMQSIINSTNLNVAKRKTLGKEKLREHSSILCSARGSARTPRRKMNTVQHFGFGVSISRAWIFYPWIYYCNFI